MIGWCDRTFNRKRLGEDALRISGVLVIAGLLLWSLFCGWLLHRVFMQVGLFGWLLEAVVVAIFLAQKKPCRSRVAGGNRSSQRRA